MPQPIDVLVVDGEAALRHHLRLLLATGRDMRLVAEMTNARQLLQVCLERQPDVLIIGDGLKPFAFNLPALIAQVSPSTKIIALFNAQDPVHTQVRFFTKLQGALFRHELDETILHGIRLVAQGNTWFTGSMLERLLIDEPLASKPEPNIPIRQSGLTAREQEVLRLLAQGLSNKAIAQALCLTEGTVEQHLKRIYRKLNVNNRVEAAIKFIRLQE